MRIAIIGAGVAGSVAGYLLRQAPGVELVCFEKATALDHSLTGTGLNIGPNAIKALRKYAPRLYEAVTARGLPWKVWETSLTDGSPLFTIPVTSIAGEDGLRIRWADLYQVVRASLDSALKPDTEVTGVGYMKDSSDRLWVDYHEHGRRLQMTGIDLVIAADGRYSDVRNQVVGKTEPRFFGVAIGRFMIEEAGSAPLDDYSQWFNGPNRLLAFRVPRDGVYVASTFPLEPNADLPTGRWDADFLRSLYTPREGTPCGECQWLLHHLARNVRSVHWARFQQIPVTFTDARRRVLFLGDAAHAMLPTLGQGATQAIEDGCVAGDLLSKWIGNARAGSADITAIVGEIVRARRERIQFAMTFSEEAADTLREGSDPVAGARTKAGSAFLEKLARLYSDL